jgi:DNA-binding NarL/FixJ family response regulator
MTLSVLLADDHRIVRQGLRAILQTEADIRLTGEAADGPETLRLVERRRPDVLVLDLMLPGLNGLEVAREVRRRSARTAVVVLSMHDDPAYVAEAVRAGVAGYVLKDASADELLQAIRTAAGGGRHFSPSVAEAARVAAASRPESAVTDPYQSLTVREREVLQLTAEGHSSAQIAGRLFISPRTVETHRANLLRKLGLRNQKELIRHAVEKGLVRRGP